jgi:hypothetical protein
MVLRSTGTTLLIFRHSSALICCLYFSKKLIFCGMYGRYKNFNTKQVITGCNSLESMAVMVGAVSSILEFYGSLRISNNIQHASD